MFNWFEIMKIKLKTVLMVVLIICKTVSIKPYINREDQSEISQFSYTTIVVTITMQFLTVVTPPSIYQYLTKKSRKNYNLNIEGVQEDE